MIDKVLFVAGIAIASMVAFNVFLTGLKRALAKIKDKTESKIDDGAYSTVVKVLSISDKVLEFLTANSSVLPEPIQKDLAEWKKEQEAQD